MEELDVKFEDFIIDDMPDLSSYGMYRPLFQKYNEMVLEICEGQAMDKQYEVEDKLDVDDYIEMVKKKTGVHCLALV